MKCIMSIGLLLVCSVALAGNFGTRNARGIRGVGLLRNYLPNAIATNIVLEYIAMSDPTNETPWKVISWRGTNHGYQAITSAQPVLTNNSLYFDGVNDSFTVLQSATYQRQFPFSVSAWIKTVTAGEVPIMTSCVRPGYYYGYWFDVTSSGALGFMVGNGGAIGPTSRRNYNSADAAIPTNTWVMVTAVATAFNSTKLYTNGIEIAGSYTGTGASMVYGAYAGVVGSNSVWGNFYLDYMLQTSNAMSASDVLALWNQTRTFPAR